MNPKTLIILWVASFATPVDASEDPASWLRGTWRIDAEMSREASWSRTSPDGELPTIDSDLIRNTYVTYTANEMIVFAKRDPEKGDLLIRGTYRVSAVAGVSPIIVKANPVQGGEEITTIHFEGPDIQWTTLDRPGVAGRVYSVRVPESQMPDMSKAVDITERLKQKWKKKAAEPGATDNPDDAQRLREDH